MLSWRSIPRPGRSRHRRRSPRPSTRPRRSPTPSSPPITCSWRSRARRARWSRPVLAKLGQSPGMVRDRRPAAVDKLPQALRRRRAADEPRAEQRHRSGHAVPQGPEGRLPVGRAPPARDERSARRRQRRAARRAQGRPRQPSGDRPEPRGEVRRAREVRPGPHPARRRRQDRPGHRTRRRDPPRHPGAVSAARRTTRC